MRLQSHYDQTPSRRQGGDCLVKKTGYSGDFIDNVRPKAKLSHLLANIRAAIQEFGCAQ